MDAAAKNSKIFLRTKYIGAKYAAVVYAEKD
jgi:hypothetical protein